MNKFAALGLDGDSLQKIVDDFCTVVSSRCIKTSRYRELIFLNDVCIEF